MTTDVRAPAVATRSGAALLADALAANGYRVIPLNPGATEEVIASALERHEQLSPLLAYQELTAAGLAAGVALATRVPSGSPTRRAAVIAHGMVGLGGMASFVTGFAQQKLPLLILVGTAGVWEDSLGKHQNPNGGLAELARGAGCKAVIWSTGAATLMHQFSRAVALAEGGTPGPVALVIPQNGVMTEPVPEGVQVEIVAAHGSATSMPDADAVARTAQRLRDAHRPVLVVGDEVARTGAVPAVVRVAELTGAQVFASMAHELCFPMDHPQWCGSLGHLFGERARDMLAGADSVVSVGGVDVSAVFPTERAPYDGGTWVTFVGTDAAAAAAMYRSSAPPLLAGPRPTMEAIAALLAADGSADRPEIARRRARLAAETGAARQARLSVAQEQRRQVDLHALDVAEALRECLAGPWSGAEPVVFNEALTRAGVIEDVLLPVRPGAYFCSQGGSLGYAGPIACGLAVADPGRRVVVVSGDGGFLYTPQWLLTAQENALDITCIVFKDDRYSLLVEAAAAQGRGSPDTFELGARRRDVQRHAPADFVALARALGGVRAERVSRRGEVLPALRRLLAEPGPAVLEALTPVPAES